mmetsp:Transcript_29200/g.38402  ORF Transcript_29200/g.38402 Transcript_29200/m.38402 type:complete len:283 (+) Transcript_29200:129-977(+)|eukprot:CAMPEP_0117738580 /NCGR_PEP_ID=MMETSP0947-20121206/3218_1 /TAXON_ID=44440 /ORGANISM="Chattonella subsalsa, Strain CCMP2191" /LENGTH=282 /DNA_ID=CAMNT_0005554305 /DNA_START=51 /DNA_END=899 /DNA_ORIENTATION=+
MIKGGNNGTPSRLPTLREWLEEKPFTLTLSSSFFGMYAHTGVLQALHEEGLFPSKLTGSSAGGLVAVCYAAGLTPQQIITKCLQIKREDILIFSANSLPGIFNIYRASKAIISDFIPVEDFEDCRLPTAVSAFDIFGMRTQVFSSGNLVQALSASMSVPLMFKPTVIDNKPYWDGALLDVAGLNGVSKEERVLYHHCTVLPKSFSGITAFSDSTILEIPGLPFLDPNNFTERGIIAYEMAYIATKSALNQSLKQQSYCDQISKGPFSIDVNAGHIGMPVSRL